jgi:tripartite-type tricarboxylate transporter receptor subunit TctC
MIAIAMTSVNATGHQKRSIPGYEASTWAGIGVPRGTPPEIIERPNREANAGLAIPAIKARLMEVGTVPMIRTPDAFAAYVASEAEKWAKVVSLQASNLSDLTIP